jgi:hypothetical protein
MGNNRYYKIVDTIYDLGMIKLNFNVSLIESYNKGDEQITRPYLSLHQTNKNSIGDTMIKRNINYYLVLDYKNWETGQANSILIPPDHIPRFLYSLDCAYQMFNSQIFIYDNDQIHITNKLPVAVEDFPGNKIFRIVPGIYYGKDDMPEPGATLVIGSADCRATIPKVKLEGLIFSLKTMNFQLYASSILAYVGMPGEQELDMYSTFKQQQPQFKQQNSFSSVPQGRKIQRKKTIFDD